MAAEDHPHGAAVQVLLRPEGVIVGTAAQDGALADVVERRAAAGYARLTCRLETGRTVQARAGLADTIRAGDAVRLRAEPAFCKRGRGLRLEPGPSSLKRAGFAISRR